MKAILVKLGWVYVGVNFLVFLASMFVAMTGYWRSAWQVPWSDASSFVETNQGVILVDIGMWGRIELYDHSGKFLGSWRRPFAKGDLELATDENGTVYFRHGDSVFKLDDRGRIQQKYSSGSYTSGNWELSPQTGEPRYVPDGVQFIQRKITKRGQILFSEKASSDFLCADGTDLVLNGASLVRVSNSGERHATYQAPWYCKLFEFPYPAGLAVVVAAILLFLKLQEEKRMK